MHKHIIFAVLAGAGCLIAIGCTPARDTETFSSVAVETVPFMIADLSNLPRTWYCRPPSSDTEDFPKDEDERIKLFAWRLFIALNWPGEFRELKAGEKQWIADVKIDGLNKPDKYPRWSSWYTPQTLRDVLRKCGPSDPLPQPPLSDWTSGNDHFMAGLEGPGFSCVYDRNGKLVEYEIRMRPEGWAANVYASVCQSPKSSDVDFAYGQCEGQGLSKSKKKDKYNHDGAIEIKLAWKVLSNEEIESGRFLQHKASVRKSCDNTSRESTEIVGLVGFHIAHKTHHYGNWIWATFEHVDNLTPAHGARTASFHDPTCTDCAPNTSQGFGTECRTQITRTTPIPADIKELNKEFQGFLQGRSVLQYYQLIGVQYKPFEKGRPNLNTDVLRNSVIETYDVDERVGDPPNACIKHPEIEKSSCLDCHEKGADFSFVPKLELCNCNDTKNRWIGNEQCKRLGFEKCPP